MSQNIFPIKIDDSGASKTASLNTNVQRRKSNMEISID